MFTTEINNDLDRMRILSALLDNHTATEEEHKEWHSLLEKNSPLLLPVVKKLVQSGLFIMIVPSNEFTDPEVNALICSVNHVADDGGRLLLEGEMFDAVFDEDDEDDDFDDDEDDGGNEDDFEPDNSPSNYDVLTPSMN